MQASCPENLLGNHRYSLFMFHLVVVSFSNLEILNEYSTNALVDLALFVRIDPNDDGAFVLGRIPSGVLDCQGGFARARDSMEQDDIDMFVGQVDGFEFDDGNIVTSDLFWRPILNPESFHIHR